MITRGGVIPRKDKSISQTGMDMQSLLQGMFNLRKELESLLVMLASLIVSIIADCFIPS